MCLCTYRSSQRYETQKVARWLRHIYSELKKRTEVWGFKLGKAICGNGRRSDVSWNKGYPALQINLSHEKVISGTSSLPRTDLHSNGNFPYRKVTLTLSTELLLCLWSEVKWKSLGPVWLCDPTNYAVHWLYPLEWVAFPFSRASSQPSDRTQVSCIAGGFFTNWGIRESLCL